MAGYARGDLGLGNSRPNIRIDRTESSARWCNYVLRVGAAAVLSFLPARNRSNNAPLERDGSFASSVQAINKQDNSQTSAFRTLILREIEKIKNRSYTLMKKAEGYATPYDDISHWPLPARGTNYSPQEQRAYTRKYGIQIAYQMHDVDAPKKQNYKAFIEMLNSYGKYVQTYQPEVVSGEEVARISRNLNSIASSIENGNLTTDLQSYTARYNAVTAGKIQPTR